MPEQKPLDTLFESLCPNCQSENNDANAFDTWGNGEISQDYHCHDCGTEWVLHYQLTRITRPGHHIMIKAYTFTQEQRDKIIALLWDSLKRDPEHHDRKQTGWGTKTQKGLIACLESIVTAGQSTS